MELKANNVRLQDNEIAANKELEQLRDRNALLTSEAEAMRKQIRAQEEAIIGAQHLKEQTDHMICDYEKMRGDYNHQMQVNNDMQMNLNVNQAGRRRAEDELFKT